MSDFKSLFKKALQASSEEKERQKKALESYVSEKEVERKLLAPLCKVLLDSNLSVKDYTKKRFSNFKKNSENEKSLNAILSISPSDDFGLMFHGDYGTGKTHLIKAYIIDSILNHNKKCRFYSLHDLMNEFKNNLDSLVEYKRKLFESDIIGIDDIGAEKTTEFVQAELTSIMDTMTDEGKILLMSSNLKPIEMKAIYGQRIYDRMIAAMQFIHCKGTSHRQTIYLDNLEKLKKRTKNVETNKEH
jgi:DNA replication protein DnaC